MRKPSHLSVSLAAPAALLLSLGLAACSKTDAPAPAAPPAPSASAPAPAAPVAPAASTTPAPDVAASAPAASPAPAAAPAAAAQASGAGAQAKPNEAVMGALSFVAGLHALGVHCGKINMAQAAGDVARLRTQLTRTGGISVDQFNTLYSTAFDGTAQRIQSQPDQAKQGCAQYEQLAQRGEQAAKALGVTRP